MINGINKFAKKYDVIVVSDYGHGVFTNLVRKTIQKYSNKLFLKNSIHHQAAVYHKRCFYVRNYNCNYSVLADYDLNLQLFLENKKAIYFDADFAICGNDGISKQKGWTHYKQEFDIKKNRLNVVQFVVYGGFTLGKFVLNRLGIL